ncbi:MFS transporter [Pseudooceanicola nanhaiensis]|uniref:MFS transporter n=1 Tax=Pseudooceanicola nanhaiensis TaxID=375761 RepID=UPI001CD32BFD|nr:MFS transporter [Pseudooceanicola nanhaiensis]MCA0919245.1 MFS transporter [Pseudooceanicola nanhaiensis]
MIHSSSTSVALLAIGLGAFGIGTTEFAPMGLLPAIAEGINVSIPAAGQLVTAYAVGVMISAPFMTLYLARFGQKKALLATMGIYILGNLLSALAPEYWSLMAGRLITSLCQGAFFGFGAVAATSLVPPEKRASAVAIMFMGTSIANIGGVPAATWLGEVVGWRWAFAGTVVLGLIALAALAIALPQGAPGQRPDVKRELATLIRPQMLATLAGTILFAGGFFTVYTYVAPILQTMAGATPAFVTVMLVLIGLGLTLGNWLGGKLADWSLDGGAGVAMLALALTSLLIPLAVMTKVGTVIGFVAWAAAAFACVPALQMRAMQAAEDAPTLAASMNIAAFNLGNAVGAGVGGLAIGAGWGYGAVPVAGAVLAGLGLAVIAGLHLGRAKLAEQ